MDVSVDIGLGIDNKFNRKFEQIISQIDSDGIKAMNEVQRQVNNLTSKVKNQVQKDFLNMHQNKHNL